MMPANPYLAAQATVNGTLVTGLTLTNTGRIKGYLLGTGPNGATRTPATWQANGTHRLGYADLALVLPAEPVTPTT